MRGTSGLADPDTPVILVNETTGKTVTVLSGPAGGFEGEIGASEDDFLSAVLVNENGTHMTIPVSRQEFGEILVDRPDSLHPVVYEVNLSSAIDLGDYCFYYGIRMEFDNFGTDR